MKHATKRKLHHERRARANTGRAAARRRTARGHVDGVRTENRRQSLLRRLLGL